MFIEDLYSTLIGKVSNNNKKFLNDMIRFDANGQHLSVGQAKKVREVLLSATSHDETELRENIKTLPFKRTPVLTKKTPYEVRFAGGNILVFRSPYDRVVSSTIRSTGGSFSKTDKVWYVTVTKYNINTILRLVKKFKADDDTQAYINEISEIINTDKPSSVEMVDGRVRIYARSEAALDYMYHIMELQEYV